MRSAILTLILAATWLGHLEFAAAQVATARPAAPDNAALQYWQAFALMPTLTDQQRKTIENWNSVPLDESVDQLLQQSHGCLMYLYRGSRLQECDWGLDYNDGISLMLPHLARARDLARLAALHGRQSFERGNLKAARDDAMAIAALSRHIARDSILICLLVHYVLDDMVVDLVAPHVLEIKASYAKSVEMFENLPPAKTLREALTTEKKYMAEWIVRKLKQEEERQPGAGLQLWKSFVEGSEVSEDVRNPTSVDAAIQLTEDVLPLYDQLAEFVDLPQQEFETRYSAFADQIKTTAPLSQVLLPAINNVKAKQQRTQARFAMLLAALAVAEGGPEKLVDTPDPFGDGPFAYRQLEQGFELKSQLQFEGQPVTVVFGKKAK